MFYSLTYIGTMYVSVVFNIKAAMQWFGIRLSRHTAIRKHVFSQRLNESKVRNSSSDVGKKRVCVIGAGPSGMSTLYHFGQMTSGTRPDIVCYEKQDDWGGLWNFSWRTGTDKYGELSPWSMYRGLWVNGPKECMEYPDYTFEEHFGRTLPSFPPRAVVRDYLEGRWTSRSLELRKLIRFNHSVRRVEYDCKSDSFTVSSRNLNSDIEHEESFDYVMVAVGLYNMPNVPDFEGLHQFHGRVIHSHDFRDAREFQGKRLLIVGAGLSAMDIAIQCHKSGSKNIVCTWRSKPMGFKWPLGIEERPLVQRFEGNTALFKDGSTAEVDAVILCTGFLAHFPFMDTHLKLKPTGLLYPDNLYKATVFMGDGNDRLVYLGTHRHAYTLTALDAQAHWACRYVTGSIRKPSRQEMSATNDFWKRKLTEIRNVHDKINFRTEYLADICKESGYPLDITRAAELFHIWEGHKQEDICTFRDKSFSSIFTGKQSPIHPTPFMKMMDDSLETFVYQTQNEQSK